MFDVIERNAGLKEFTAKLYLGQICRAVEFMHSKSLVHRDIKLENVVLADRLGSVAQLIDFGLTLGAGIYMHGSSLWHNLLLGTRDLLSSMTAGFIVDPSSDVWSVGILLFCMLTEGYPWKQATLTDPHYYGVVQWQCGISTVATNGWLYFSPDPLSLFKKMLAMDLAEKCTITEVYKYLNCSWLNKVLLLSINVVANSARNYYTKYRHTCSLAPFRIFHPS